MVTSLKVNNEGLRVVDPFVTLSTGFVKLQTMETWGLSFKSFFLDCGLKEVIHAPLRLPALGKKSA